MVSLHSRVRAFVVLPPSPPRGGTISSQVLGSENETGSLKRRRSGEKDGKKRKRTPHFVIYQQKKEKRKKGKKEKKNSLSHPPTDDERRMIDDDVDTEVLHLAHCFDYICYNLRIALSRWLGKLAMLAPLCVQ